MMNISVTTLPTGSLWLDGNGGSGDKSLRLASGCEHLSGEMALASAITLT